MLPLQTSVTNEKHSQECKLTYFFRYDSLYYFRVCFKVCAVRKFAERLKDLFCFIPLCLESFKMLVGISCPFKKPKDSLKEKFFSKINLLHHPLGNKPTQKER